MDAIKLTRGLELQPVSRRASLSRAEDSLPMGCFAAGLLPRAASPGAMRRRVYEQLLDAIEEAAQ